MCRRTSCFFHLSVQWFRSLDFFFFNDTATTEIYTLSLHDALPISLSPADLGALASIGVEPSDGVGALRLLAALVRLLNRDRKSTRLNSSHGYISYAVFCLKKKNRPSTSTWTKSPPGASRRCKRPRR